MKKLNVFLLGTVEMSYSLYDKWLAKYADDPRVQIAGMASLAPNTFNADYKSLQPLAEKYNLCYFEYSGNDQDSLKMHIEQNHAEVLFCFGWPYLLKQRLLDTLKLDAFGFHPSDLPKNRGRHPIIWALALGLTETASTFFKITAEADAGEIISKKVLPIDENDHAGDLYQKIAAVARTQVLEWTELLLNDRLVAIPQNLSAGNSWRKRSAKDGQIDWRISARNIHNLVRALHPPYPGATFNYQGQEYKLLQTQVIKGRPMNLEPGYVVQVGTRGPIICCGEESIELINTVPAIELKQGDYVL